METIRRRSPFWACAGLTLMLMGCDALRQGSPDTGVTALQFDDIPVPDGMRLREKYHASDSLVVGEYRYANFVYSGVVPVADVSAYLQERMPLHSWELEDRESETGGDQLLRFRRGQYIAECDLRKQHDSSTRMLVKVRTALEPQR